MTNFIIMFSRSKYWVFTLLSIFIVMTILGIHKIKFDLGFDVFIQGEELFERQKELVNLNNDYQIDLSATNFYLNTDGESIFSKNYFAELERFTQSLRKLPFIDSTYSLLDIPFDISLDSDEHISTTVRIFLETNNAQALRPYFENNELFKKHYIANNLKGSMIEVFTHNESMSNADSKELTDLVDEYTQTNDHNITALLYGRSVYDYYFSKMFIDDLIVLIPIIVLGIIILYLYFTRSIGLTLMSLVITISPVIFTMAIAAHLNLVFTLLSTVFFVAVLIIGVADIIHIVSNYSQKIVEGANKEDAVEYSLQINSVNLIATTVTTIIGFLGFTFSVSEPIRELGIVTALGVFVTFICAVFIFPYFLKILPIDNVQQESEQLREKKVLNFEGLFNYLSVFVSTHRVKIIVLPIPLFIFILWLPFTAQINDDSANLFPEDHPMSQSIRYIETEYLGFRSAVLFIKSDSDLGVADPEYIKNLNTFRHEISAQDNVAAVFSLDKYLEQIKIDMKLDGEANSHLESSAEISQLLLLLQMAMPDFRSINSVINYEKDTSLFLVSFTNLNNQEFLNATQRLENSAKRIFKKELPANGYTLLFAKIVKQNSLDMIYGAFFVLLGVVIVMAFVLKSLKLAMISVFPNIVPLFFAYSIWVLIGKDISMAASLVFGMTLGIVVDDTIHFISKFQTSLANSNSFEQALSKTYALCGPALVTTSIILMFGFGVASLANFEMIASIGFISLLCIGFAIIFDLIVLPAILIITSPRDIFRDRISAEH